MQSYFFKCTLIYSNIITLFYPFYGIILALVLPQEALPDCELSLAFWWTTSTWLPRELGTSVLNLLPAQVGVRGSLWWHFMPQCIMTSSSLVAPPQGQHLLSWSLSKLYLSAQLVNMWFCVCEHLWKCDCAWRRITLCLYRGVGGLGRLSLSLLISIAHFVLTFFVFLTRFVPFEVTGRLQEPILTAYEKGTVPCSRVPQWQTVLVV